MAELSTEVHEEICRLCTEGDTFAESGQFPEALTKYWKAFDLLPEPQHDWEAATWILAAIGDANFLGGDFVAGRDNLSNAMHCPDAIGNPFLHLRLGQCQFELGNFKRAADELARAFLFEGEELFQDEDPKYLEWIKPQLREPPGGWK
ncbi:MAG: tetratricopeptide repeat protein [bacterium]|nr:tetratricopeptide repeat protein [bacterium]